MCSIVVKSIEDRGRRIAILARHFRNPFIVRAEEPGRPCTILQSHVLPYKNLSKGHFSFFLAIVDFLYRAHFRRRNPIRYHTKEFIEIIKIFPRVVYNYKLVTSYSELTIYLISGTDFIPL